MPINNYIRLLDGVFSFVLYDKLQKCLTIGHDPLGVRPLYWSKDHHTDCKTMTICSEMKSKPHVELFCLLVVHAGVEQVLYSIIYIGLRCVD